MDMKRFLKNLGTALKDSDYTCMIYEGEELVFTSRKRGVAPLVDFISGCKPDADYFLADKVIGKAAALLCAKGGIRHVYTQVVSAPAADIFYKNNIDLLFDNKVPAISNRSGTGLCPMESLSKGVSDPDTMYDKVVEWLKGK